MSYLAGCKFITSILSGQHYSYARSSKSHSRSQITILIIIFSKFHGIITNRYHFSKKYVKDLLRKISNFLCPISSSFFICLKCHDANWNKVFDAIFLFNSACDGYIRLQGTHINDSPSDIFMCQTSSDARLHFF